MFEDQSITRGKCDEGKEQKWAWGARRATAKWGVGSGVLSGARFEEASFYRWRQVIGRRDAEVTQAETSMSVLAPVVMVEELCDKAKNSGSSAAIEILLHGRATVRVPCGSTSGATRDGT